VSGQLDNGTRRDPTSPPKPPSSEAQADGSAEAAAVESGAEATADGNGDCEAAAFEGIAEATADGNGDSEAAAFEGIAAATADGNGESNAVEGSAAAAAQAPSSSEKYKSLTGLNIRARLAARMKPKGNSPAV
jgi:hypothetical protein